MASEVNPNPLTPRTDISSNHSAPVLVIPPMVIFSAEPACILAEIAINLGISRGLTPAIYAWVVFAIKFLMWKGSLITVVHFFQVPRALS